MGAEFIELNVAEDGEGAGGYAKEMSPAFIKAEMEMFAAQAKDVDIIITTALIPESAGADPDHREMVKAMKNGLGDRRPGRRERRQLRAHRAGQGRRALRRHILGYTDLPSRLAPTASLLFGNNLTHLLADLGGASHFHLDLADEVVRGALVLRERRAAVAAAGAAAGDAAAGSESRRRQGAVPVAHDAKAKSGAWPGRSSRSSAAAALVGLGLVAPPAFLSHLTVFALACIVGWQVVWNVTPALHTPLMSVTNAISGIIVIGGMLQVSGPPSSPIVILGAAAILLATINIAGGFLVTQRMLNMFREAQMTGRMPETLVTIAYLAAGLLFIFSLGGLSGRSRRGAATCSACSAC